MKYRKLFIVMMSVLTMLTAMPATVKHVEAETEINRIYLYGVREVKDGQKATLSGIRVASNIGYHLDEGKSYWYNESDFVKVEEGEEFVHNKMYRLHAFFVPDTGYKFAAVEEMQFQLPEISSRKYEALVGSYGNPQENRMVIITFNTNRDKYTISFDANGGMGEMESVTAYHDDYYELPQCGFIAPGAHLVFDKWNLGNPKEKIRVKSDMFIQARWKVADGYSRIKKVELIAGILPAVGEKPVIFGWESTEPEKYQVIQDLARWMNVTDHLYMDKEDVFMASKVYQIDMIIDARDKYFFETSPVASVTIRGLDGSVYKAEAEVRNYNSSLFVSFIFNPLPGYDLLRLYGSNRFGTSMAIADHYRKRQRISQHNCIILACSDNFADALAGSYLAAAKNAPILIVNDSKAADIEEYIKAKLAPTGEVYILGGEKAVSAKIEKDLKDMDINVTRLAGSNRYGTNLEILKEAGSLTNRILVATGTNFADSLSASATGLPILLVGTALNEDQKDYLNSFSPSQIYILGGTGAVSETVESEVSAFGPVKRISGENRYQTSLKIADEFFYKPGMVILANGDKFPDGLCAGPVGYLHEAPLILIKDGLTDYAIQYAEGKGLKRGIAAGGTAVISDRSFRDVFKLDSTATIRENN